MQGPGCTTVPRQFFYLVIFNVFILIYTTNCFLILFHMIGRRIEGTRANLIKPVSDFEFWILFSDMVVSDNIGD